ncbi:membrane protein [Patiriisocius marinistellae]|uniref:Membrane protein n=1 Tax=Patiriisocius marinistellae TaxID=2494560 RepID=A0A5J4FWA1_9FLAO|nr:TolC family protein [Patiriisocius marinistellae]GEQ85444.1 membrane protein [Patiriisocius marinistellae]
MKNINIVFIVVIAFFFGNVTAQELDVLTKQEAIAETLQNNFGIQIANNNLDVADNNQNILNSGYLPSLTGNAGATYDLQNQKAVTQDGEIREVNGAETTRYNASVNLNYTLFDGLGRYYDYKALKEEYNLSELQTRETIETSVLQLFSVYYEVARLTENITVLEEVFANTKRRLKRAEYAFEYGQNNKLDVLNAEVDIVTDSINLMNARQLLSNTKRDLNVVANVALERTFAVDTTVIFIPSLVLSEYVNDVENSNVRLLQAEKNKNITELNYKASKSIFLPSLGLTGSYGWNEGNFPSTSFQASSTSTGLSAGLNLSWDLFDGGRGITTVKNSKIAISNQEIFQEQFKKEVKRDIANAQGDYLNRLQIFQLQEKNVSTAANNFERSNERYKLGQISSVELRQAQVNLLNAKTDKNLAKYQAKLAELQVLQLAGQLLNIDF